MVKTEIRLAVTRKISTDKFESLDVVADITEVIEWKSESDRSKKIDKVTKHLVDDFRKAYNTIIREIGVKRSLATAVIINTKDETEKQGNITTDEDDDFDILD